jgi:putative spermidine/putrescine transport system ATP-binding protein
VATPVELYEQPASRFVAGFVGTSNLVTGELARDLGGHDGPFSIRPEKIHLDSDVESGNTTARGTVADVVYLGSVNHYLVELDAGPTLTVLKQNLGDSTDQAMSRRGQQVTVGWAEEHVIDLSGHTEQARQPEKKEKS